MSQPASEAAVRDDHKLQDDHKAQDTQTAASRGTAQAAENKLKQGMLLLPQRQPTVSNPVSDTAEKPLTRPGPVLSPNRHNIRPQYQPTDTPKNATGQGDTAAAARPPVVNGRSQGHRARPSANDVYFNPLRGSAGSSPAPPPVAGGIAPPPGMALPDGRQPYMGPPSGAYPPGPPPGLDAMAANNLDAYGRPNLAFPPVDPYRQHGSNFPPSTPHSFQESQSPGHPEESGPYQQFAGPPPQNGPLRFADDALPQTSQGRIPGGMPYPGMGPQGPPPPVMPQEDDSRGLVEHFQQQFGQGDFADCFLELRHRDQRVTPIKIPGHRVVFARSPVLNDLLRKNTQQATPQVIALETDDEWIRPDSFYMAFQPLYGFPLFHVPPPAHSADGENTTVAGSTIDRFTFALSYAAAGHILNWEPIVRRGCQIAAQFLTPDTIEMAMQFALSQYRDIGSYPNFKYGSGSCIILDGVLDFIARMLPPSFQLDTSVTDARGYSRLPYDIPTPPIQSTEENPESPVIVAGKARGHIGKSSRGQSHPHIQFGDLSLTNGKSGEPSGSRKASQAATRALQATLSRILINLPFTYLKMAIESGPNHLRQALWDTVLEREARRARAVDVLKSGRMPNSDAALSALHNLEPPQGNPWSILGWEEEITFSCKADGPSFVRQWVPLKKEGHGSVAAYP